METHHQILCDHYERMLGLTEGWKPFSVDVAADVAYSIPTPDHVLAAKNVLVIEDDAGLVDVIPYAHIRRISFAAASQAT
jgi:hypothetical protein